MRRYFSFAVLDENEIHRGVCFSPNKYRQSEQNANDTSNNGIDIKSFKYGDNNSDIIVNDFSSVKGTELNFKHKAPELKTLTLQKVFNECPIVNMKGLVYNLQNDTTVSKYSQSLRLRKGMIEDEQDRISLVLFGILSDVAYNDKYSKFKTMSMQKYMNDQLLKPTETSTVVEI